MKQPEIRNVSTFETSIVYRQAVELARTWVISHWLAKHTLPEDGTLWVYSRGPEAALDWGDDPTSEPEFRPMKGKRIQIVLSVQDMPDQTARDRAVNAATAKREAAAAARAEKFDEAKRTKKPVVLRTWTEVRRAQEGGEWWDYLFTCTEHANPDGTTKISAMNYIRDPASVSG